jgi:hypothetical protein
VTPEDRRLLLRQLGAHVVVQEGVGLQESPPATTMTAASGALLADAGVSTVRLLVTSNRTSLRHGAARAAP